MFNYKLGSLLQRAFDPFATATRLENGTLFMKFTKDDLNKNIFNEEKLREEFERNKNSDEIWEINEDEENALRIAIM